LAMMSPVRIASASSAFTCSRVLPASTVGAG
jgi:hypothetical protein